MPAPADLPADPRSLLALATYAARRGGEILLAHQRRRAHAETLEVDTKSTHTDPVSQADRDAELAVVAAILDARPDDGIVAEESVDNRGGTTGVRWVIDPLDGTVNFLHRIPQWAVSVAAVDAEGRGLVGVVHHPDLDETFRASRGTGAWLGEQRLSVPDPAGLDEVTLVTGFAYDQQLRPGQLSMFSRAGSQVRYVRRLGAAAIDLAWVTAGRVDAYYEAGLHPWDWAAGTLLVEEAGGRVSHVDVDYGGEVRSTIVAAGPGTHDRIVSLLTG